MSYSVICIARVGGSVGPEVARLVADSLGYRLVDEEIVQRAAAGQGVTVEELAEVEKRKSVLSRLLEGLAFGGTAEGMLAGAALPLPVDPGSLRELIQRSIHETADDGNVVIVSHAASFALAGRTDVLRVLVTASTETRQARLLEAVGGDQKAAAKAVSNDDAGRAAYLKSFYGVDQESPSHYDLVLNSDRLSPDVIAGSVVALAR